MACGSAIVGQRSIEVIGNSAQAVVNADAPLYERDPEAWQAHLAEGNTKPSRRSHATSPSRWDYGLKPLPDQPHLPQLRKTTIRIGSLLQVVYLRRVASGTQSQPIGPAPERTRTPCTLRSQASLLKLRIPASLDRQRAVCARRPSQDLEVSYPADHSQDSPPPTGARQGASGGRRSVGAGDAIAVTRLDDFGRSHLPLLGRTSIPDGKRNLRPWPCVALVRSEQCDTHAMRTGVEENGGD
jgi:hypothetical protein